RGKCIKDTAPPPKPPPHNPTATAHNPPPSPPAGTHPPPPALNTSPKDGSAAAHPAILTGNAAVSRQIDNILNKLRQGTSRHIS
ncbi:hypothetical protein CWI53_01195, partial [Neisseria meningitidis]